MTRRRPISATERAEIFERFKGVCHICELKIDGGRERWEPDHIIPVKMGGSDERGSPNIQPAHVKCHAAKTAEDQGHIAKAKRQRQRDIGIRRQPKSRGFRGWQKFDGTPVWRDEVEQ